jgi:hypothetical protein
LTNVKGADAIVDTMKFAIVQGECDEFQIEAGQGPQRGARRRDAGAWRTPAPEAWEQTAQVPDEREDEIDCQRIVQGDDSRRLPVYYDDYN